MFDEDELRAMGFRVAERSIYDQKFWILVFVTLALGVLMVVSGKLLAKLEEKRVLEVTGGGNRFALYDTDSPVHVPLVQLARPTFAFSWLGFLGCNGWVFLNYVRNTWLHGFLVAACIGSLFFIPKGWLKVAIWSLVLSAGVVFPFRFLV